MTYSIEIKASAQKSLQSINKPDRQRLITAIYGLADDPLAGSPLKGDLAGLRRLRVGNYRVVYQIQERQLTVLVVRIGHRREVYR